MEQVRVRVSEKGRVVIPAEIREKLGIKIGDLLTLRVEDNELRIATLQSRIEQVQKRMQKYAIPGKLMSDVLIEERRAAAKLE